MADSHSSIVATSREVPQSQELPGRGDAPRDRRRDYETLDRIARAALGRVTQGLSPHATAAAWFDWCSHLARAPGRQLELAQIAAAQSARLASYALARGLGVAPAAPFAPPPGDRRFDDPAWEQAPFDLYVQGYLALEQFWRRATDPLRGQAPRHAERVRFMAR